jgi:hypothetical protein
MENIIYHNNQPAMNTFPSNLKSGIINPLTRKSYKQIININTRFRNNYSTTSSTNFGFNLPTPIKKVASMKLSDIQIPAMVYTISPELGSNSFLIGDVSGISFEVVTIPVGSYTACSIKKIINTVLSTTSNYTNVKLNYNNNDGKMTFTRDPSGFSLDFNYIDPSCSQFSQTGSNIYKDQLTLGWLLGFRKNYMYNTPQLATKTQGVTNQLTKTGTATSRQVNQLNKIRNARPSLTQTKNGLQYLKNNYTCCSPWIEPTDISYIYTGASSYTGEAIYDNQGSKYFLLSVNDYQNNSTIAVVSPLQEETLGDGNILAKIPSECCDKCCIEYPDRIYFGPTDITKLHITLYDEFGRIVDMNNGDYSFTLELEIIYDL